MSFNFGCNIFLKLEKEKKKGRKKEIENKIYFISEKYQVSFQLPLVWKKKE